MFCFSHGVVHRIGAVFQGQGGVAVRNQDQHGILQRILPVQHIQHVFRFGKAFGQRCFSAGGHGGQFFLGEVNALGDRKQYFRLVFPESDHADPVTFLIGFQ